VDSEEHGVPPEQGGRELGMDLALLWYDLERGGSCRATVPRDEGAAGAAGTSITSPPSQRRISW
jgi:hypothetical protein